LEPETVPENRMSQVNWYLKLQDLQEAPARYPMQFEK
jgi:hypothetical protein